ncbi:Glycolipid 2-alpha-mannosyltransferase 2 [Grifola frondosa]|uniref:Glycolipid 2-alpha-mannosyltransferase 2 n=1 Tax=Grifola frondosa TaxID=5627 RepID=A0A1C7ME03_GRIFR|nr:Glycolipid 2-alpha-mannosyltransferase 2 [Grifola frondosa]
MRYISLHFILSFSHEDYGRATSISHITDQLKSSRPSYEVTPSSPQGRRANATFDRVNKPLGYPYVFLNEEPFTKEFKERVSALTDAKVEFGLIPKEDWYQPNWIDEDRASAARLDMIQNKVIYGGRHDRLRLQCSGFSDFFSDHRKRAVCVACILSAVDAYLTHCLVTAICAGSILGQELLAKYKYYWRVEPDVTFYCDLDYDPFLFMQDNNKVYVPRNNSDIVGLRQRHVLQSMHIHALSILISNTTEFIRENPDFLPKDNAMSFISDDGGETYNNCHFWSNFEIGDLDLWRGEAYSKFFDYLDQKGGFYYERWGDAPVHSIGAALFAHKDQIHFFDEIGYKHNPFQHCPQGQLHEKGKCWCDPKENFDFEWYSCLKRYNALF